MYKKIREEIENNSVAIFGQKTISQHLYNDGKNIGNLKAEKAFMLSELVKKNIELVNSKKYYPVNDLQDIDLEVDLIIIDRETFNRILKNV